MTILVTGAAGFIGYFLCKRLLDKGYNVIGLDNINDYYSLDLKLARLQELGITSLTDRINDTRYNSESYSKFIFYRVDTSDLKSLDIVFKNDHIDIVCHLAAQAGVRYSIENPSVYIQSNLVGFSNILEKVRETGIHHLIYASSSSVYGESKEVPFDTEQRVDHPISLYAATKKSNELMAHTYSHLYGIATTGLRFFTVYGPLGRPDMAYYKFTKAILENHPIKVFNNGDMWRDFTFVDDIVECLLRIVEKPVMNRPKYKIYNIGNNKPELLSDFVEILENHLGKKAEKQFLPMQPGDVTQTYADVSQLIEDYDYKPHTKIEEGLKIFVDWYLKFNK